MIPRISEPTVMKRYFVESRDTNTVGIKKIGARKTKRYNTFVFNMLNI
jgi:hypothetical protein